MSALATADRAQAEAYLVSRGTRPLAVLGCTSADRLDEAKGLLVTAGQWYERAIPFIVRRSDGEFEFGFAAAAWVIDCYRWLVQTDTVPEVQRERVFGLLFGYGTQEIGQYDEATRVTTGI